MLFLSWWKQVLKTGLQDGKWSGIFMWLFCNCRIMLNKDPLQLHQYFIPFGCWWPQGFPYHVKLSEMKFFTLYSRWNFPFLLLSILLTYFRNDFSGFIPNIAAVTQPLFLALDTEMHLLLLYSLCLCNFPLWASNPVPLHSSRSFLQFTRLSCWSQDFQDCHNIV